MELGDSFTIIIVIMLAAGLFFVFPLMTIADRNDDITQMAVQTALQEFVEKVASTGVLTQADLDALVQKIAATGNNFEVSKQAVIMDENIAKKVAQASSDKIGENQTYVITDYNIDQILSNNGKYTLKEGDSFKAVAVRTNTGLSGVIHSIFGGGANNDIIAEYSATVTAKGN